MATASRMHRARMRLVAVVLCLVALVVVGRPLLASAQVVPAAANARNVQQLQSVSRSLDGLYAPALEAFTDGSMEGWKMTFSVGTSVSYLVNAARTHYVLATTDAAGRITVSSDTVLGSVACDAYAVDCVARVTGDPELLAAQARWVDF